MFALIILIISKVLEAQKSTRSFLTRHYKVNIPLINIAQSQEGQQRNANVCGGERREEKEENVCITKDRHMRIRERAFPNRFLPALSGLSFLGSSQICVNNSWAA